MRIRDPFIAKKLKSLVIIFNEHAGIKPPSWEIVPGPAHVSKNLVVRNLLLLQSAIRHSREATFTDFGTELIARVPTFTNVTELTIDCWDPLHCDLSSLYESFWWAFGDNLVSLTLKGYLESHASVISSSPALGTTLKHLRIDFGPNIFVSLPDTNRNHQILVNNIAPFVKSLSPHLEGLNIRCWTELDMSPFFAVCNSFPRLRHLAVRMGFSRIWQDTYGLQSLLHSSGKTLRRLEMRLNRPYFDMHMRTGMNTGMDTELGDWLLERLTDEQCMSQVCELDLYPTRTHHGLGIVVASVKRASATLAKLTIRDWSLNHTEVATIIDALSTCQKLRYLRMNLVCLDINVLDFVAARLPNLKGLSLSLEGPANSYMFRVRFFDPRMLLVWLIMFMSSTLSGNC